MSDNKIWRRTNEGYFNNKQVHKNNKRSEIKKVVNPNSEHIKKSSYKDVNNTKDQTKSQNNKRFQKQIIYSQSEQQQQYPSNNDNLWFKDLKQLYQQSQNTLKYVQQQNLLLQKQIELLNQQLIQQKQNNAELNILLMEKDQQIIILKNQLQSKYQKSTIRQTSTNPYDQQFITQTLQQINKLKTMVNQLTLQNQQLSLNSSPTQRQEIKDRIIIKLQDQIITLKLLLKEQKQIISNQQNQISSENYHPLKTKYYDLKLNDDKNNKQVNQTETNKKYSLNENNYDRFTYR